MEQNQKPYQAIAWTATAILILAAILASFVPELEYHHWAFISANSLWVIVGIMARTNINRFKCWTNNNIHFRAYFIKI